MNNMTTWIGLGTIIICSGSIIWMLGGRWFILTFMPNMLKPLIGKKPSFTIMLGADKDNDKEFNSILKNGEKL